MRALLLLALSFASYSAYAEGACPPGQYPIGGGGVVGCAPIPGAAGATQGTSEPKPTGKWETRWGAIAEDASNMATGTSVSYKSERAAKAASMDECKRRGGLSCKLRITYHNQCVALADPTVEFRRSLPIGATVHNMVSAAETVEMAKANAIKLCESSGSGQECTIVYSDCSMSEFKAF